MTRPQWSIVAIVLPERVALGMVEHLAEPGQVAGQCAAIGDRRRAADRGSDRPGQQRLGVRGIPPSARSRAGCAAPRACPRSGRRPGTALRRASATEPRTGRRSSSRARSPAAPVRRAGPPATARTPCRTRPTCRPRRRTTTARPATRGCRDRRAPRGRAARTCPASGRCRGRPVPPPRNRRHEREHVRQLRVAVHRGVVLAVRGADQQRRERSRPVRLPHVRGECDAVAHRHRHVHLHGEGHARAPVSPWPE